MRDISISFVIPTWNRRNELERLLESLLVQKNVDFETVVIDNNSSDGTGEYLSGLDSRIAVIHNRENLGAAQAKNQGLVASRGEFVWFLDSDSEFADVDVAARAMEIMGNDGSIGALGGEFVLDRNGLPVSLIKRFRSNGETANEYRRGDVLLEDSDYLPTCNCLVRREPILRWGGFDPAYFMLSEDDELGYALRHMGYRCVVDSRALVIHHQARRSRVGTLMLSNRNRVRFAILNMPLRRVLMLPVFELIEMLRPSSVKQLFQADGALVQRYSGGRLADAAIRRSILRPMAVLSFAGRYLLTLLAAYAYQLACMPMLLRIRRSRPDYLSELEPAAR